MSAKARPKLESESPKRVKNARMSSPPVPEVTLDEAGRLLEAGALLLDVREAHEWSAGHAADATWIPMGAVPDRRSELPEDRQIIVVCAVGARSARVTDALVAWGYDAVNLAGGMHAWVDTGFPVVTEPEAV
jgi:rhodanese-related sulfurtransferase